MGVFDWKIDWKRTSDKDGEPIPILDCISATITKSTEIKNNICSLTLKNSAVQSVLESDSSISILGEYVEPTTQVIKFGEEDELRVWADYLTDASEVDTDWSDDARLLGAFLVREYGIQTMESQSRIILKACDIAYIIFNAVKTASYGISNKFTSPGIIRRMCREFGEANEKSIDTETGSAPDDGTKYAIKAKFVSEGGNIEDYRRIRTDTNPDSYTVDVSSTLNGAINASVTTITLTSTTGFENAADATIVIDSEHISYTGVSGSNLTGCTRGIDDTVAASHNDAVTVYQGFPLTLFSKIWKPLFEWIGELSQSKTTNFASETLEGGTTYFNRAFLFWVDKNNSPHWAYPDDQVDLTVDLGEEGRRAFNLTKAVFDAVNFVIYNAGEDMYGNGIMHYLFDQDTEIASMKMRFQPMIKIVHDLVNEDIRADLAEGRTRETTNQDKFKNFVIDGDYPITPSFLELANLYRGSETGGTAWTEATNDTDYNTMLRDASKWKGLIEAKKITTQRSGLRYRGQIALKGVHLNPGDLIKVTNGFNGLKNQKLRVINVTHNINQNGWNTTIQTEEDETTV